MAVPQKPVTVPKKPDARPPTHAHFKSTPSSAAVASRVVEIEDAAKAPAPRPPARGRSFKTSSPTKARAVAPPTPEAGRGKAALVAVAVAALLYFRPSFPAPHAPLKGVFAPPLKTKLQIVGLPAPTRLAWKRDGGIALEAAVTMRMFNDKPVPVKLRSLNTTVLLRSLFGTATYAAGYQAATKISLPPKGHADVPAKLVLYDLRLLMLPAVFVDLAAAAWAGFRSGGDAVLEVPLEGVIKLWPAGRLQVSCTMQQPLNSPVKTNVCRPKLF